MSFYYWSRNIKEFPLIETYWGYENKLYFLPFLFDKVKMLQYEMSEKSYVLELKGVSLD